MAAPLVAPFAVPYVLPAVSGDDLNDYDIEVPSGPIVPPVFTEFAEERRYWWNMRGWYIQKFKEHVEKLKKSLVRKYSLSVRENPLMQKVNDQYSVDDTPFLEAEAEELALLPQFTPMRSVVTYKHEFLRKQNEYLIKLGWLRELEAELATKEPEVAATTSAPAPVAPAPVKRTIIDLSSDSDDEAAAEAAAPAPKRAKRLEDEENPEFVEFLRAVGGPRHYKK